MTSFTDDELRIIGELAALGPADDAAVQRLSESFTGVRLFQAAQLADQVRAGEAVTCNDGSVLLRAVDECDGRVLREVTE